MIFSVRQHHLLGSFGSPFQLWSYTMKKHFYMACLQVVWRADEETDSVQVMPVNVITAMEKPIVRRFNLAQINASAVNNLSKMIDQPIRPDLVAGVTLMSLNSLGYMSDEEFDAQPMGTAIQTETREVVEAAMSEGDAAAAAQAERA